jgi:hypothetical protein
MRESTGSVAQPVRPLAPARRVTALTANSEALIHQGKTHLPHVVMPLSDREFLHQKQADPDPDAPSRP